MFSSPLLIQPVIWFGFASHVQVRVNGWVARFPQVPSFLPSFNMNLVCQLCRWSMLPSATPFPSPLNASDRFMRASNVLGDLGRIETEAASVDHLASWPTFFAFPTSHYFETWPAPPLKSLVLLLVSWASPRAVEPGNDVLRM